MKRQHPIAILRYMTENFRLLLLPLVRGVAHMKIDFHSWARGAYIDIIILAIIVIVAVLKWHNTKFKVTKVGITLSDGIIFRRKFTVPFSVVSTMKIYSNFFLVPFRAAVFYFDSDTTSVSEKSRKSDIKLLLKLTDYKEICDKIPFYNGQKIRVSNRRVLFFSLAFSSALSGLLYIAAFLIYGSRFIDDELIKAEFYKSKLYRTFLEAAQKVSLDSHSFVEMILAAMVGGWLISFLSNCHKHMNFKVARKGKMLSIERGLLSKRKCCINSDRINFADFKQTSFMKLCRVMSVQISCAGYGKIRNEIPVLIPALGRENVLRLTKLILPEMLWGKVTIKARKGSLLRYEAVPLTLIFGIQLTAFATVMFFPDWYRVILFAAVIGELMSLNFYAMSMEAFFTNGAVFDGGMLTLKYTKFLHFHHVVIPQRKIIKVKIRQSFMQKINGTCDLIIFTVNEKRGRHRVNGLDLRDVILILKKEHMYG